MQEQASTRIELQLSQVVENYLANAHAYEQVPDDHLR